jgi:hypothetical protein
MNKNPRRSWWQKRSTRSDRAGEYRADIEFEPVLERVIELGPAEQAALDPPPPPETPRSDVVTAAGLRCVIGVLSAGLDSSELQNWAMDTLIPRDSEGLSDFLAALYVMARVLLGEVRDATGQPREEILQRLALTVENGRGKPLPGW